MPVQKIVFHNKSYHKFFHINLFGREELLSWAPLTSLGGIGWGVQINYMMIMLPPILASLLL
jgi:hypothetical protein